IRILAELLTQEDFGIMAIALIVVGVVEIFAQVGIGPSVVQFSNLEPKHIASAWWFSAGLGLLFFGMMYVLAPEVAHHYGEPTLRPVLRWISLSFVISGFSVVSRSLLVRDMNFKTLTGCALAGMVIGNLMVGLTLAYNGAGVWAYVSALLVQNAVLSLGYLWFARVPLTLGFKLSRIRQLLGYGFRSTAFNLLTYAAAKVDLYFVGEKMTTGQTGLYDRAVHLMGQPITVLGKLGDSVLFSGLSSIQKDEDQMRQVTLRAMHLIALITIPLASALVVQAEGVTWLFLGDPFAEAAPVVQILFAAVAFRALTKLGDANLRALDGLRAGIGIKLVFFVAVGAGVFAALEQGLDLQGAAWAVVTASCLQWVLTTGWVMRRLGLRLAQLGTALRAGIGLALLTTGTMLALSLTWWQEAALAAALGAGMLLLVPAWIAPAWTDPQGTLRASLGRRLPAPFQSHWDD
ncbi:MAG: lipopolysaccharide biosynthesis protein, partial [Flavobacteriales bacterium]